MASWVTTRNRRTEGCSVNLVAKIENPCYIQGINEYNSREPSRASFLSFLLITTLNIVGRQGGPKGGFHMRDVFLEL